MNIQFIGYQEDEFTGESWPLFNVLIKGHVLYGSTVSLETLESYDLKPESYPEKGE